MPCVFFTHNENAIILFPCGKVTDWSEKRGWSSGRWHVIMWPALGSRVLGFWGFLDIGQVQNRAGHGHGHSIIAVGSSVFRVPCSVLSSSSYQSFG